MSILWTTKNDIEINSGEITGEGIKNSLIAAFTSVKFNLPISKIANKFNINRTNLNNILLTNSFWEGLKNNESKVDFYTIIELFEKNSYNEINDFEEYEIVKHFANIRSFSKEFENICLNSGIKLLISKLDFFNSNLEKITNFSKNLLEKINEDLLFEKFRRIHKEKFYNECLKEFCFNKQEINDFFRKNSLTRIPTLLVQENKEFISDNFELIKSLSSNYILINDLPKTGKSSIGYQIAFQLLEQNDTSYLPLIINFNDIYLKTLGNSKKFLHEISIIKNKYAYFFNNHRYSLFIFIDNFEKIPNNDNERSTKELYSYINDFFTYTKGNSLILISKNKEVNNIILQENNSFYIRLNDTTIPDWISNTQEALNYKKKYNQAKNRYELYKLILDDFLYFEKSLKFDLEQIYMSLAFKLKNEPGSLSYYDLDIELENISSSIKINHNNPDILKALLSENSLIKFDNSNKVIFKNDNLMDYLTANYIYYRPDFDPNKLKIDTLKNLNWRSVFLFLGDISKEKLGRNDKFRENIYNNFVLIMLYHLRQNKNTYLTEIFIKNLTPLNNNDDFYSSLMLENAKNIYYEANYEESIKFSIKAKTFTNNNEILNKINAHISNCLIDLFIPDTALEYINISLENPSSESKPRFLGVKSRCLFKKGKITEALEVIKEKYNHHKNNMNYYENENIRDITDIILAETINCIENFDQNKFISILEKTRNILEKYSVLEKSLSEKQTNNKIFVYRNISYIFPFLNIENKNLLWNLIKDVFETNEFEKHKYMPMIYLNIRDYIEIEANKNQKLIEERIFELIPEKFLENYKPEAYFTFLYLYSKTFNDYFFDNAIKIYNELKENSVKVSIILEKNNSNFILPLAEKDNINSILKKVYLLSL